MPISKLCEPQRIDIADRVPASICVSGEASTGESDRIALQVPSRPSVETTVPVIADSGVFRQRELTRESQVVGERAKAGGVLIWRDASKGIRVPTPPTYA
jgi:hypothetical protein